MIGNTAGTDVDVDVHVADLIIYVRQTINCFRVNFDGLCKSFDTFDHSGISSKIEEIFKFGSKSVVEEFVASLPKGNPVLSMIVIRLLRKWGIYSDFTIKSISGLVLKGKSQEAERLGVIADIKEVARHFSLMVSETYHVSYVSCVFGKDWETGETWEIDFGPLGIPTMSHPSTRMFLWTGNGWGS